MSTIGAGARSRQAAASSPWVGFAGFAIAAAATCRGRGGGRALPAEAAAAEAGRDDGNGGSGSGGSGKGDERGPGATTVRLRSARLVCDEKRGRSRSIWAARAA